HPRRRFRVEIGRLLRKSLPFLRQLQNLAQVRRPKEEGGGPGPLVHPGDRLPGITRVDQKLLRVALAEQVVDHLGVKLDDGDLPFQWEDLELMVPVGARRHPATLQRGQRLLERSLWLAAGPGKLTAAARAATVTSRSGMRVALRL